MKLALFVATLTLLVKKWQTWRAPGLDVLAEGVKTQ